MADDRPILDYARVRDSTWRKWFNFRPKRSTRWMPWIALILIAYGTIYPGWVSLWLCIGLTLLAACMVGVSLHLICSLIISPEHTGAWGMLLCKTIVSIAIALILLISRPTLYLSFWLSKSSLARDAQTVIKMPFTSAGAGSGRAGLYQYDQIHRCPHGIYVNFRLAIPERSLFGGRPPIGRFFYRDSPGACQYFDKGKSLGDGWYWVE